MKLLDSRLLVGGVALAVACTGTVDDAPGGTAEQAGGNSPVGAGSGGSSARGGSLGSSGNALGGGGTANTAGGGSAGTSGAGVAGGAAGSGGSSGMSGNGGSGGLGGARDGGRQDSSVGGAGGVDAGRGGSADSAGASVDASVGPPPVANLDSGPKTCRAEPNHMGGLTSYTPPSALPNCGIPYNVGAPDGLYAAMATADYGNSSVCGMCVQITGPTGIARVVHAIDQCPVGSMNPLCIAGHIDLSVAAYQQLAPPPLPGAINNSPGVPWKYVACPVTGNIVYHFKDGVNPFYAAVQIRNSKYGIANLRYRVAGSGGAFQTADARVNNLAFFVINQANSLRFDFQVTDVNGQVLGDNDVSFNVDPVNPSSPGQDRPGHAQFPNCTP